MTALTGVFSKEIYDRFAGPEKSGRNKSNDEVTIFPRWP